MNTLCATYGALRAAIVHATAHAHIQPPHAPSRPAARLRGWIGPRDHGDARARAAADFLAAYPSGSGR